MAPTARRGRGRAASTREMIASIGEITREIQPCSVRALASSPGGGARRPPEA